jgi:PleD family two-component response regulator
MGCCVIHRYSLGRGASRDSVSGLLSRQDSFQVELTVSRPLVLGLTILIALLNPYLLTKRMELRKLREELISTTIQHELTKQQSFTDPLTEIYNRHSLEEMTGRYISYARRTNKPLTMLLVDIDRFKEVNTKFGHLTGDFVLADVAALLKISVRGSDAVFRYGGDELSSSWPIRVWTEPHRS